MPRLSLWNPTKQNDYKFIDRVVGEHIFAGGTGVHVHKYIGVHETPDESDPQLQCPGNSKFCPRLTFPRKQR